MTSEDSHQSPIVVDSSPTRSTRVVESENDGSLTEPTPQHDGAHLTDAEVRRIRAMLDDGSFENDASRLKWFLIGFLAAIAALVVAAALFLVVSDDDSDGRVDLDVPTVDVDG